MNKPLVSFLLGVLLGYSGVRWIAHLVYIGVITALVLRILLK